MSLPASYEQLHDDATRRLDALDAWDERQDALRARMLDQLRAHPDAMWREGPVDHFTASAIVFDPALRRVLLVLHRKANLWLQPGGHFEPQDTDVVTAALREVREETGVNARPIAGLLQLDHHELNTAFGRCRSHLDLRAVAIADDAALRVSPESLDVRWWPVDALPELIDPRLPATISAARAHATPADCS